MSEHEEHIRREIQQLDAIWADPIYRYTRETFNYPKLTHIDSQWFSKRPFLEYLECDQRYPQCPGVIKEGTPQKCTSEDSCLIYDGDQWTRRIHAFTSSPETLRAGSTATSQPPPLFFACQACGIQVTEYIWNRLPCQQPLTTFRFIWNDERACRTPFNAKHMVCQACYRIWQMCDSTMESFGRTIRQLFRPLPQGIRSLGSNHTHSCFLPFSERLIYENRIDLIPRNASKGIFHAAETLQFNWVVQRGLVQYSHLDHTPHQDLRPIKHIFATTWIHSNGKVTDRTKGMKRTPTWSEDAQMDYEKRISEIQTQTQQPVVEAERPNPMNLSRKRRQVDRKIDQQNQIQKLPLKTDVNQSIQFWIAIDPNTSSRSLFSKAATALDRSHPCSESNYSVTIELLHHLEQQFEYAELIDWMTRVCYWNMGMDSIESKFTLFKHCHFQPLQFERKYSFKERWFKLYHHPRLLPSDHTMTIPKHLVVVEPKSGVKDQTVMTFVNYTDESELKTIREYVRAEILKLFPHTTPQHIEQLYGIMNTCMELLRKRQVLLEMKRELTMYYNQHLFPDLSRLRVLKLQKKKRNRAIQPILTKLQRAHRFQSILEDSDLGAENGFRIEQIKRFTELEEQEQIDYLRLHCAHLRSLSDQKLSALVKRILSPTTIDEALGTLRTHSQQVHIVHPDYKKQKQSLPKRQRFEMGTMPSSNSNSTAMQIENEKPVKKNIKKKLRPEEFLAGMF